MGLKNKMYELEGIEGRFFGKIFTFPARVYYEDTDAGGIVYYANYLRFAERARTEYIRALGKNQVDDLNGDHKCGFVVKHCDIEYHKPAFLDDCLTITCEIIEIKGASAIIYQQILRGDELLAEVNIKAVYLDIDKKRPLRMPKDFLERIDRLNKKEE